MQILIDTNSNAIIGFANSAEYATDANQILIPAPPGFAVDEADEWSMEGGALVHDQGLALTRKQAARITEIKAEAAAYIDATDWRLQRAREREAAGWASLAEVDAVLAQREAVRRSSDAAEAAVLACTTAGEVAAVQWSPADVAVPPPCRATHAAFLDALNDLGEDVIPAILAARDSNPALLKWWTYFDQAQYISGTDPRLAGGLHGLEFAGLLPEGGAAAVLAKLNQLEVSQP